MSSNIILTLNLEEDSILLNEGMCFGLARSRTPRPW